MAEEAPVAEMMELHADDIDLADIRCGVVVAWGVRGSVRCHALQSLSNSVMYKK